MTAFGNQNSSTDIALSRFLTSRWNPNSDEDITVYELNEISKPYGDDADAIELELQKLFSYHELFSSLIDFSVPLAPNDAPVITDPITGDRSVQPPLTHIAALHCSNVPCVFSQGRAIEAL